MVHFEHCPKNDAPNQHRAAARLPSRALLQNNPSFEAD